MSIRRFVLLTNRILQIQIQVKSKATVDAHGYVIYISLNDKYILVSFIGIDIYIHVWASALFVSTWMGNARALVRGTSNWYSNPHFFVSCTKQSIDSQVMGLLLGEIVK